MLIVVPTGAGVDAVMAGIEEAAAVERDVGRAFARAAAERRDLLLLAPDVAIGPETIAELRAVAALDPMTGFVDARAAAGDDAVLGDHLPRSTYLPVAAMACTLVRWTMAAEFGPPDPAFATVAGAVVDLALRANRRGYRSVRANRAAYDGGGGAAAIDATDRARLDDRHPALALAEHRHAADPARRVEQLVAGLAPVAGRLRVLFDCRMMHGYYSGTCEHARQLLVAFVARHGARFDCHVLVSAEGYRFHRLDAIAGLGHLPPDAGAPPPFAVAFRLAQPFDLDALVTLVRLAPVAGVLMLDTIALDCQHLDEAGLGAVWGALADCAALIGFNSDFSERQFAARFAVPADTVSFVSLCSTATADYAAPGAAGDGILLVGNHYPHKALAETVAALAAIDAAGRTTVLGVVCDGVAASHAAGSLPQATVDALYDGAGVLLFPSHYEGFGLPVMQALARRKPVVARDLPCLREIAVRSPVGHNIHFAGTTADLAARAACAPAWDATVRPAGPEQDWGLAADAIADAVEAALARFDYAGCVRRHRLIDALAAGSEAVAAVAAAGAKRDAAVAAAGAERDAAVAAAGAERDAMVARATADRAAAEADSRTSALRAVTAEWDADVAARAVAAARSARTAALAGEPGGRRRWFAVRSRRAVLRLTATDAATLRSPRPRSAEPLAAILERLLDTVGTLVAGTRVRLVVPDADVGDATVVAATLRAIGCRVDRVRGARGGLVGDGALILPPPPVPTASDDLTFVQLCARLALGRAADPVELGAMLRDLACGETRTVVWRRMLAKGACAELLADG